LTIAHARFSIGSEVEPNHLIFLVLILQSARKTGAEFLGKLARL